MGERSLQSVNSTLTFWPSRRTTWQLRKRRNAVEINRNSYGTVTFDPTSSFAPIFCMH